MRIFFLAQRVPYPPDRGDKITTFNEIRHLAERHEVEVFCLADGRKDIQNVPGLASLVKAVHAVPLSPVRATMRALLALFRPVPLTVAYFNETKLRRVIRERSVDVTPDIFLIYSSGMAQFVEELSGFPRIMQFAELDSMKWEDYARMSPAPKSLVYRIEARRLLDYERHIAETFSHCLVCTEQEKNNFEKLIPSAKVSCVPNGVDFEYFRPTDNEKVKNSLVFTGVMDYYPNVDGIAWFCNEILPIIQKRVPDVHFTICGRRPSRRVRALAGSAAVTVTGAVPEVASYLDAAQVAVVPLRIARGVQNKLLEAMSMGLPCVTTSAASSGILAEAGRDLLVADRPEEFAAHVIRLLEDGRLRETIGERARKAMKRNYDWNAHLAKLEAILHAEAIPEGR
jgi:sugar transferase (PEP-CTERM/EpsH1 system associated)